MAVELLIILLLISLGINRQEDERETVAITAIDVRDATPQEDAGTPEPAEPAASRPASADSQPQPTPLEISPPASAPLPSALPIPATPAPPRPVPTPTPTRSSRIGAVIRSDSNYGPADTGPARGADTAIVGTAPDGSPLYAASWYREPYDSELSGYLSAANSSGWGLIACKTAPNWRVEDCEIVDEYPNGSGIAHATQQAAWQFQVRPPRVGGTYQVGSWVRIRITYTNTPRRSAFGTR